MPGDFFSFRHLGSKFRKMKRTEPEESRKNLSSFPCELLSNAKVGGDDESPEIKIFELQVMSDGDVEISQSRGAKDKI